MGFVLEIDMHEAQTRLPQLVERAERGEETIITRDGTPTAQLPPVPKPNRHKAARGAFKANPSGIDEHFGELPAEIGNAFGVKAVGLLVRAGPARCAALGLMPLSRPDTPGPSGCRRRFSGHAGGRKKTRRARRSSEAAGLPSRHANFRAIQRRLLFRSIPERCGRGTQRLVRCM